MAAILARIKKGGNAMLMGGGIAFAIFPSWAVLSLAFLPFLFGHLLWMQAGRMENDKHLVHLNLFLAGLDILAIVLRYTNVDISKLF